MTHRNFTILKMVKWSLRGYRKDIFYYFFTASRFFLAYTHTHTHICVFKTTAVQYLMFWGFLFSPNILCLSGFKQTFFNASEEKLYQSIQCIMLLNSLVYVRCTYKAVLSNVFFKVWIGVPSKIGGKRTLGHTTFGGS